MVSSLELHRASRTGRPAGAEVGRGHRPRTPDGWSRLRVQRARRHQEHRSRCGVREARLAVSGVRDRGEADLRLSLRVERPAR